MKNSDLVLLALFVGLSSTVLGYYVGSEFTDPVIEYQILTVEVPKIIVVNHTIVEVQVVEVPQIIVQYNTTIHEVLIPTPIPLRDFPDRSTLITFILLDDTNSFLYEPRWTCMDYAMRVIKNAERLGYRVIFVFMENEAHAVCMAYVEEEAQYVAWEPQSDRIQWSWRSTAAG